MFEFISLTFLLTYEEFSFFIFFYFFIYKKEKLIFLVTEEKRTNERRKTTGTGKGNQTRGEGDSRSISSQHETQLLRRAVKGVVAQRSSSTLFGEEICTDSLPGECVEAQFSQVSPIDP